MKRLTINVSGKFKKKSPNVATTDLIRRLGEYEDTGLRPGQVRELQRKNMELRGQLGALHYQKDILVAANKDLAELAFCGEGNG